MEGLPEEHEAATGTHPLPHPPGPGPPPPDNPGPVPAPPPTGRPQGAKLPQPPLESCRGGQSPPQAACLCTRVSPGPARTPSLASQQQGLWDPQWREHMADREVGGEGTVPANKDQARVGLIWHGRPTAGCRLGPQEEKPERGQAGTLLGRSPPWAVPQPTGRLEGRVRAWVVPPCGRTLAPTHWPQMVAQRSSPPQGTGWPLLRDQPRL